MSGGVFVCRVCGRETAVGEIIGRRDNCESCGAALRSCLQCRHHDPAYSNDCRELQAEPVPDKEKANFCEFYQPAQGGPGPGKGGSLSKSEADRKWEELFGKK